VRAFLFVPPRGNPRRFFFLYEDQIMSYSLPNGSLISIASAYGVVKEMTALSNANPAIATLEASHDVVLNDILEVTSGWELLSGRILKAGTPSTGNVVPLVGFDASSTARYPAGSGVGSVREITTWDDLPQILEVQSNGGEQQYAEYQPLSAKKQKRKPTVKSAQGMTLRIGDDPSLAIYDLLREADQDGVPRAVRLTLPDGSVILYNASISFDDNPTVNVNQIMTVGVTLSFEADITRYEAA
jgi:hypothetical protein